MARQIGYCVEILSRLFTQSGWANEKDNMALQLLSLFCVGYYFT